MKLSVTSHKTIEHSCMGKFRDMGILAQVVKKKSCTSGEVPKFAHAGMIFIYESQLNKHFFLIWRDFFCQTAATSV
jgi:hypothetical protein